MIPPTEEIVCKETLHTNNTNSEDDNEDPVFESFSTETYDPSDESFEHLMALSDVVGEEEPISDDTDKGVTLFTERN